VLLSIILFSLSFLVVLPCGSSLLINKMNKKEIRYNICLFCALQLSDKIKVLFGSRNVT
jgi:hypothetical protein